MSLMFWTPWEDSIWVLQGFLNQCLFCRLFSLGLHKSSTRAERFCKGVLGCCRAGFCGRQVSQVSSSQVSGCMIAEVYQELDDFQNA